MRYVNDVDLKRTSVTQQAAKKYQKIWNLTRKKPYERVSKNSEDDLVFKKQIPIHPMDRLKKANIKNKKLSL